MPQIFKIGGFLVYFWLNEGLPSEPIHVHIAEGVPSPNATKIWITSGGGTVVCNNNSHIPDRQLRIMMEIIKTRRDEIEALWIQKFGTITYYC